MSAINYDHTDGVATISLNSPPQNRMTAELAAGLGTAIQDLSSRQDTRVLVLNATGPDFSYGGDITTWPGQSKEEFSTRIEQSVKLTNALQDFPFPTIVAIQGYCGGGGFEIALRGDVLIAADNARFCHSEASIGVFTFLGGIHRVAERVGRTRAMQWALTAEQVDARTALDAGLINEVVPLDQLETATQAWVDRLKGSATLAHATHKTLLRAWSDQGIAAADALLAEAAGSMLHTEDAQACLPDAVEAVVSGRPRPSFTFQGK